MMSDARHWMIAAESRELKPDAILSRRICDQALVLYRDAAGAPVIASDRCLHRCGKLSSGRVKAGRLTCAYHGWTYGEGGKVVAVPSEGGGARNLRLALYETREQEGYIYVRLERGLNAPPYAMPHYGEHGFARVRLVNVFENTLANCAENYVDVPHTAYVHPGIFRKPKSEKLSAGVTAQNGEVRVDYHGETRNLGWFSRLLNPKGGAVKHIDKFIAPNVTHVRYEIGANIFLITSQIVPETARRCRVYTELAYRLGLLTPFAAPFVRAQGQRVIDQDMRVLADQNEVLTDRPAPFIDSPADIVHAFIHELRSAVEKGEDPCALPPRRAEIEFWV